MPKLPVVSGKKVVKLLTGLGYEFVRQKGSHIKMKIVTKMGEHVTIIPDHKEMSKGTLNDIINDISLHNNIPKDELLERLRNM